MIGQIIIHAFLFIVMLFLYITAMSFPESTIDILGPEWWPQLILSFGMVLTVISATLSVRKIRAGGEKTNVKITKEELTAIAFSSGIIIVALIVIGRLGFLATMPILLFGFMFQLGCRKPLILILFPIICSLVLTLLFGTVMQVHLPRGMGILRTLSFYLY